MKTPKEVARIILETAEAVDHQLQKHAWQKDPKIGWWRDQHPDHYVVYHGTHEKNLAGITKNGITKSKNASGKEEVSMTHDPHTAHGYASMHGGEANFRGVGGKAQHTPHEHRAVIVAHVPKDWAHEHMDHDFGGNMDRKKLSDKSMYDAHKATGRPDHEHYAGTELRFKKNIPPEFIRGYTKKKG